MSKRSLGCLFMLAILLVACSAPLSSPTSVVTEAPIEPAPSAVVPTPYPAPSAVVAMPYPEPYVGIPEPFPAYPEPITPGIITPNLPASGYEPQPGDTKLQRDNVLVDLESSTILTKPTAPTQVYAILEGTLSDPCHELRVVVTPPNASNTINLNVYSVFDPSVACIMVIKPFSATIPLGSYTSGEYTVMVNGEELGSFVGGY